MRKLTTPLLILWVGLILASCAHSPERYYFGNYSEAERLYNKGDYRKAVERYQAYLNENPEGNLAVISKYYIGKSYAALGQVDKARTAYQQILEKHPDLVWANFAQNKLKELEVRNQK